MAGPVMNAEGVHESDVMEDTINQIVSKEDEIKARIRQAENEAQRLVEEAKLDAAVVKRRAVTTEVGGDLREKELRNAHEEAEKVSVEIKARAVEVKARGMQQIDKAVKIVIDGVLPH